MSDQSRDKWLNPQTGTADVKWVRKIAEAFPAFKSSNYVKYFWGQLISLIGTWLQIVAQGWLVLKLTNSAFLIGLVTAMSTLPTLFFTLFGGVIVDRLSKKKILIYTQFSAMILAFALGLLSIFDLITVWLIALLAFMLGMVNALDAPARQAFVSEIVSKDQLTSAIAINSSVFNGARVIGPGLAGLLIAWIGTGGAFIVNGVSYIAVLLALTSMKLPKKLAKTQQPKAFRAIKDGLKYTFTHPVISTLILLAGIISIFGWSYTTLLPFIAQNTFHLDATGLGYLYAASGLGSLLGALIVGGFSRRLSPLPFIFVGNLMFVISISLFTFTTNLPFALLLMFLSGMGLLFQAAMINTSIQRIVKDEFRGRVMSIYILMFLGMTPIGNLQIGYVSETINVDFAIRLGAAVVFLGGLIIFVFRNKILSKYKRYKRTSEG
ncbi:MFS transporter [Cytophagaceae bacterium ABcell3]|nr:MFS transporter [Cytophagaceae bacterium ABcell3]